MSKNVSVGDRVSVRSKTQVGIVTRIDGSIATIRLGMNEQGATGDYPIDDLEPLRNDTSIAADGDDLPLA